MLVTSRLVASLGPALALAFIASSAFAQPSPLPGGGVGGPPTGASGEEEEKPAGIAEAAPKSAGLSATTPTVPPRRDPRKKFEVLRLDGFLRARGDWFKNFNLGFIDQRTPTDTLTNFGGAPYPQALHCKATSLLTSCGDTIKSSNLKLRLEPRIELTNSITVHSQIDLLDNLVLGSTPVYDHAPLGAFSGGATVPQAGVTSGQDSIVVRRAWAEVATALVLVKFGRMPDHFGLGIVANSGRRLDSDYATWETLWMPGAEADVGGINRTDMDLDSDYGDTVDRASVVLDIPGTPLRAMAALDWVGTGTYPGRLLPYGQDADVDDIDDTTQWMLAIARMDAPGDFQEKLDRGDFAYNFGGRLVRRTQDYDYNGSVMATNGADKFVARGLSTWNPDVWFKVGFKKVLFEAEAAASIGSITHLEDYGVDGATDIRSFGGVARVTSKAFDDKLVFGLEYGLASGDDGEAQQQGHTNLNEISYLPGPGDRTISRFVFDPDYRIDLILFRELIGSVSNAMYFRPRVSYSLTKAIKVTAQNVTSAALKTVSTPGNATFWGTEFDADLGYSSGGFHAGMAYGVLFPLGAMDHPTNEVGQGGTGFPFGTNNENAGTASNAHTFQLRLGVEF